MTALRKEFPMKVASRISSVLPCLLIFLAAGVVCDGCGRRSPATGSDSVSAGALVGAWRSQVRFKDGAFAGVKDLTFMYVFNAGGTMTESSNYDAAPPVPPAYGAWRQVGPGQFEAHYEFFVTKAPSALTDLTSGGGWLPAGRGVLVERIALAQDARSFTSSLTYSAFDSAGNPVEGGGEANVAGTRIGF
jgi:hypothetical protein